MTAKTEQPDEPDDIDRFRLELARNIERFIAKSLELWATCENTGCRRAKRCVGEDRVCMAKLDESLPPLSPEEERAHLIDFKIALDLRVRLGETGTPEQLEQAIREDKAARRAAMQRLEREVPAHGMEGTKLAPEQIDRGRNDCVADQDSAREPEPRITKL